jgi:DNA-binding response OmpR family regulator
MMTAASPKKCVLLVDDDPAVREALAQVLQEENYRVFPAANGILALSIIHSNLIDLVLLDLNMPEQSGWDTFERLTTENPLIPVLVITARANQLFTAVAAGVDALLEKPLDVPELLVTMEGLLREAPEQRLARRMGKTCPFRYLPAHV